MKSTNENFIKMRNGTSTVASWDQRVHHFGSLSPSPFLLTMFSHFCNGFSFQYNKFNFIHQNDKLIIYGSESLKFPQRDKTSLIRVFAVCLMGS